ncbi:MAG TPA: hypothetical protein PLX15_00795 [Candidatus Woesearchaeota archaeon]|nr:hypothetical protein [Candidatus Woesearchaeota archaeon]
MKMSLEAEKFLKKVYAILMLCLTLPGLVGATSINFTLPTESSRVGASETDLIIYQFNLTTNNDATIAGLEPTHGETLTATNPWSGEDVKFYNDSENWNPATDWIGYDTDDDNFYTSYADALVDADEEATLGAGTTSLVGTEVLVQYSTGNGAGPVICVDNLTNPSAVRLDEDGDCTNGTTKEGLYILDGAAVEATAEIEAIAKADFVDNQDGVVETYNITLRADSSGDLNTTSFLLYDGDGSVCFWFDVDDSGALLTDTHATCQGAGRSVEITGVVTDGTAEGVAGQVQSTINSDSKFSASVDGAVVSVTTIDAMDLSDAVDINVGGAFSISIIQHGEDEVPADYFTLNGYGDCYIFWFDKLGNDGGAPAVGGCADAVKIDVSSTTTNESVQEAITSAISGHGIFSAVEGASNYITLVTQNFAGVSGNLANTENVANGDFALASFTGGDNTATGIEADTTYYYYRGGASSGDYQSGDELFLNPDFTIAGSIPSSAVAITSTNPWSDVYFFDDGDTFWGAAVDWIGTSDDTTYLDVFEDLMIENTGNATNSDITNVLLYEGADCLGTNVELSYSGGKWGNNTIDWNLSAGLNTYTICADIVGSPTDDATIVIQIAQDDLGLASGTLPTGAGLPATGDITIDTTLPTATPVSIVSDNANSSLAKVGDNVSITFTVSEFVDNVVVTIDTNPADAIVNTGGFNWVAYRVMQTGDTQGAIAFTIDFEDEAGNPATTISSTTDASSVTFDETAPSGYSVTFDESYAYTGNEEAISFTFAGAEVGATYDFAISDGVNPDVTGSGTIATATDTISSINVSSLNDGTLTLSVTLTDPAGNQGGSAQDTAVKDTDLPGVVSIVPSELAEADVGVVTVDITFDEDMQQADLLTVNVMGLTGSPIAVAYDSWQSATVWRGTFTLSDNNETIANSYYAVSGARDLAWNLMTALSDRQANNPLDVDTTVPTATPVSIVSDNANSSLAKVGDNVSITFTASEFVDNVSVIIDASPADAIVNTGGFNWVAYRVMQSGDTQVTPIVFTINFEDEAGNPATTITSTTDASAVIFDETAPSGYSVDFVQDPVNGDNEDSISFNFTSAEVGATYNYAISDGVNPDVSGSGTIITATDTISSIDVSSLDDGTLTLTVYLTDPAGNQGTNTTDTVTKDSASPEVVEISPAELSEADVGSVQVDITFDNEMNQVTPLTVSVEGISGGSSAVTGDWFNSTVWRGTFTFSDNNETVTTAYFAVSGGRDLAGNTMTALSERGATNSLDVDTEQPEVLSAVAVPDPSGAGLVTVTVMFTEGMDTGTSPTVQILDLAYEPYALVQSTYVGHTWTGTFTLDDENEEETGRITVSGGVDLFGNTMTADTNAGTFEVDTLAPSGYSVAFVQDYVNSLNEDNITISFSDSEVGADYDYAITSNGGAGELTGSGTIIGALQSISVDVSTLADGELTVTLVLTDGLGNIGSEVTNTITKDTVSPALIDDPIPSDSDALIETPETITVPLSDEGTGINESTIVVNLNDGVTTHLDNVTTTDAHVSFNSETEVVTITPGADTPFELAEGLTTVIVYANDVAGNEMEPVEWDFIIDAQSAIVNSVQALPDDMICALAERENLNDELYLEVNATDQGLAGVEYVYAFYTDGNISLDFDPDLSGLTTSQLELGNGTTVDYIEFMYNESTGIWQLTLPLQNTSGADYEVRTIGLYVIDEAGNEVLSDVTTTAVFYDFTGPEMDDSCDRNGASTTNFCDILDWSDVEYTFSIEKNANPECNNGGALPWYGVEDWMEIFSVTFYGLDFTSPDTWAKLPQLASAIEPYITPPGQYGDSYISVNSTFFAELNVTADVSFYGLPFAEVPVIIGDALQEASVSFTANDAFEINIDVCEVEAEEDADLLFECYDDCEGNETCEGECDTEFFGEAATSYQECLDERTEEYCAYTTLYGICSVELGEDQYITYYVPNGELHFSVDGFSQYDITDDQEPIVTITSPEDSIYGEASLVENITFEVDGTGSQISSLEVLLNDEPLLEEPLDYFGIYMDDEYCVHDIESPDSVLCNFALPELEDGEHTITIVATDFGGEEGNEAEESVTFVYDTTPPEITIVEPTNTEYYYGQSVSIQALIIDNLDEEPEFDECVLGRSDSEDTSIYDLEDTLAFHVEGLVALDEGEYYNLTCYLFDHAENEGSTEVHFVVLEDTEEGTDLIPSEEETEYEFDNETTTAILPYTNVIETIIVPTGVNGTQNLNLSQLIDSDGNARFENGINLSIQRQTSERNYTIAIPDGTVVTPGEEWDGLLKLPEVKTSTDYSVDSGRVNIVVEFGNDIQLDFSNPVQIVITGVGSGKRVGWTRGNASLNVITTECNDKDAPTNIPEGRMCYLNVDGNMYIWTYHFTEFGVYTPVSSSSVIRRDTCITQWICSDWGECANGLQERTCEKELSYCAIREEMPSLTQSCGQATATPTPLPKDDSLPEIKESVPSEQYEEIVDDNEVEPLPETLPVKPTVKNNTNAVFLGITLFALIAVIVAIALFTKRKKD